VNSSGLDETKYYHVRISVDGETSDETKLDLSAELLERTVLDAYRNGLAIAINGRVVPIDKVRRVRIGESDEPAVRWFGAIRAELANLRISQFGDQSLEWRAAERARDITERLIIGPPGSATAGSARTEKRTGPIRPNSVFLVAGRDNAIVSAVMTFLRSMQIGVLEWEQAVQRTGRPNPYVGDVVETGMSIAGATLVLLTPDDITQLREDLLLEDDSAEERTPRGQARPNVFYEAGFADSLGRDRTIIVEAGPVKPFSDIAGRHLVRLDGSAGSRNALAGRLKAAGLTPDLSGRDWLTAGDITDAIRKARTELKDRPPAAANDSPEASH
jgi:predicted nucleotide-binding protein